MNMQALMAQAQKMQKDIEKKKKDIENKEFTGESEWISVTFNGKRELKNLKIKYTGTIDGEDKEMLEDMLNIAINDAMQKIENDFNSSMGAYGNSLNGLF